MPFRALQYETLAYTDTENLSPADVVDPALWQTGPTTEGTWPGSPPAAPQTEVVASGPAGRVHARVGGASTGATGTVDIFLKRNGSVVDSASVIDPSGAFVRDLYYPPLGSGGWPAQVAITAGDVFEVRVENNADVAVQIADSDAEAQLFLRIEEDYSGTPITETELCDDLFVTQPGGGVVLSYVSSTQVPGTTYDLSATWLHQPWWIGFRSNETDFGVSAYDEDRSRSVVQRFATGTGTPASITNRTSLIDEANPFAIEYDHDDNLYLLGYKDEDLRLHKFDSGGSLLTTWVVDSSGSPGVVLALDVDNTGRAYYTEVGTLSGGSAYLYCFDTISGTQQPPALTLNAGIDANRDWFGAFRLLMGTQGGVVISRREFVNDGFGLYTRTWLELYSKTGALFNQVPVEDGRPTDILGSFSTTPDVTPSLCYGESSQLIWAGRVADTVLQQFDVNTNAGGPTITPAGYHYGIVSCTAEEGDGFVFTEATARRGGFFAAVY